MKKSKKNIKEDPVSETRERPIETEEVLENQSLDQKKISFAQSQHIEAVIQLLKESTTKNPLVGETSHATVVNAVTLDAQSDLINNFIHAIDSIKKGSLHRPK